MAGSRESAISPSVRLMQQNTRLVVLTLEVRCCRVSMGTMSRTHQMVEETRPRERDCGTHEANSARWERFSHLLPNGRTDLFRLQGLEDCGVPLQLPDPPWPPAVDTGMQQPEEPQAQTSALPPRHQQASSQAAATAPGSEHWHAQALQDASQQPEKAASDSKSGSLGPLGYMAAFPAMADDESVGPRPAAVRLLIAYMGAMLGAQASAAAFVQQAAYCYR